MKRLILSILVLLLCRSHAELNIVLTNVVMSYQAEDARASYTGRPGEIVRNTDRHGFTMYDNIIGGEIYNPDGRNLFRVRASGTPTENGLELRRVADMAEAYVASYPIDERVARRPLIIIESGEYLFTTTYSLPDMTYMAEQVLPTTENPISDPNYRVTISDSASGTLLINSGAVLVGIWFDCEVWTSIQPTHFYDCSFANTVKVSVNVVEFTRCLFHHQIIDTGVGYTGGAYYDCMVANTVNAVGSFPSFVGNIHDSSILATGCFAGVFGGSISGGIVSGAGAFASSGISAHIDIVNCTFINTSGIWFTTILSHSGAGIRNCNGISSTLLSSVVKVANSTDQGGTMFSHNVTHKVEELQFPNNWVIRGSGDGIEIVAP